ncbi:MAG: hypothetical protein IPI44_00690 [Sulfuritalea sp.]|nr:hypothetical protein [Sulfuritalea sp.]
MGQERFESGDGVHLPVEKGIGHLRARQRHPLDIGGAQPMIREQDMEENSALVPATTPTRRRAGHGVAGKETADYREIVTLKAGQHDGRIRHGGHLHLAAEQRLKRCLARREAFVRYIEPRRAQKTCSSATRTGIIP